MLLIQNPCTDPHFNLALDEYLLTGRNEEFFTLWRNEPSVIIGRNQDALREINLDFLREEGIHLVRRMSGGGAVFHDLGNINFTYITPCERADFFNFQRFAAPILSALQALGIDAQATGRNDLTIDGKKFSGNAQHLHRGRLLHHGTLLFSADVSHMQGALNVDPDKLKGKGVSSVKSRVTNLADHCPADMDVTAFLQYLESYIAGYFPDCTLYTLPEAELRQVEALAAEKYCTDRWNLLHMGSYAITRAARFPAGQVELSFQVESGGITAIRFSGDFFGIQDIAALERALTGVIHTPDELRAALGNIDVGEYISGLSPDDLLPLFF